MRGRWEYVVSRSKAGEQGAEQECQSRSGPTQPGETRLQGSQVSSTSVDLGLLGGELEARLV